MARSISRAVKTWNTKLHIYIGLFSLLYLWLFAVTGFLLNHPQWFGSPPERVRSQHAIEIPANGDEYAKASAIMEQLRISGEYLQSPPQEGHLVFRVLRPGRRYFVDVDLQTENAVVTTVTPNAWAKLGDLHTSSGVRAIFREPEPRRDWIVTKVWSFAMDAICVGLILLVMSSLYMWIQLKKKRIPGLIALGLGCLSCAFFLWGLSWLA